MALKSKDIAELLDEPACEHTLATAAAMAEVGSRVRIFARRGAGEDHPVPPGFVEGRHLKVLLACIDRGSRAGGGC